MLLDLSLPRRRQAISLTPLIDVVFILLLFFMLSSSFVQWRRIDLPLPAPGNDAAQELLVLRLQSDDGRVAVAGRTLQLHDQAALAQLVAEQGDKIFAIEVASGVTTQAMIRLLDALKAAGAEKVSLAGVLP